MTERQPGNDHDVHAETETQPGNELDADAEIDAVKTLMAISKLGSTANVDSILDDEIDDIILSLPLAEEIF